MSSEVERLKAYIQELEAEFQKHHEDHKALQRMRRLINQMPSGVLIIGNRGVVTEFNPAAEELLGTHLLNRPWVEVIQECFAPRPDDGHELSLRNGKRVSLSTRALDGEPGQLVFISDQTQTRDLQARLSHYQRLSEMGRMVASMAHQIRTPLSAALLYASHLMAPKVSDAQRVRFAGKVKSRLTHLEQQVRDMLVFARGEIRLDDQVTTDELMMRTEELLDLPLSNADADCDCINDAPGVLFNCNLESLLGVLLNLVNNSLQAVGKGAELQLRITEHGDRIRIDVFDQGPGMSAEDLARAQEPFFTTKTHGTGLGLAVAQVVARGHQGEFHIQSALGQGTTASLILPSLKAGLSAAQAEQASGNDAETASDKENNS